jgi:hypothetical protein
MIPDRAREVLDELRDLERRMHAYRKADKLHIVGPGRYWTSVVPADEMRAILMHHLEMELTRRRAALISELTELGVDWKPLSEDAIPDAVSERDHADNWKTERKREVTRATPNPRLTERHPELASTAELSRFWTSFETVGRSTVSICAVSTLVSESPSTEFGTVVSTARTERARARPVAAPGYRRRSPSSAADPRLDKFDLHH